MIELLITLLLVALVVYVVHLILDMLSLPSQVKTIAYIIIGVVVLFWLLSYLGIYSTGATRILF